MTDQDPTIALDELAGLTIDLSDITLGEMLAIELASGEDFARLLGRQTGRRLIALYLRESRSSGRAPSWHELSSLRLRAGGSSTSASPSAGRPTSSSD